MCGPDADRRHLTSELTCVLADQNVRDVVHVEARRGDQQLGLAVDGEDDRDRAGGRRAALTSGVAHVRGEDALGQVLADDDVVRLGRAARRAFARNGLGERGEVGLCRAVRRAYAFTVDASG